MLAASVVLDVGLLLVTIDLPVSKTDARALGCKRTWGCVCASGLPSGCPYHAAARQWDRLRRLFGQRVDENGFPFFPNRDGAAVSKSTIVYLIETAAAHLGRTLVNKDGRRAYGGHAFRVGGARHLAMLGIAISIIMLMARWGSDLVMHYLKDSPLAGLTSQYISLAAGSQGPQGQRNKSKKFALTDGDKARIDDLAHQCAIHEQAIEEIKDDVEKMKIATTEPRFFVSLSGVWHETLPTDDLPSREWKAKGCGWRYGRSEFRRERIVPGDVFFKLICDRCLPQLRKEHERRQNPKSFDDPVHDDTASRESESDS